MAFQFPSEEFLNRLRVASGFDVKLMKLMDREVENNLFTYESRMSILEFVNNKSRDKKKNNVRYFDANNNNGYWRKKDTKKANFGDSANNDEEYSMLFQQDKSILQRLDYKCHMVASTVHIKERRPPLTVFGFMDPDLGGKGAFVVVGELTYVEKSMCLAHILVDTPIRSPVKWSFIHSAFAHGELEDWRIKPGKSFLGKTYAIFRSKEGVLLNLITIGTTEFRPIGGSIDINPSALEHGPDPDAQERMMLVTMAESTQISQDIVDANVRWRYNEYED